MEKYGEKLWIYKRNVKLVLKKFVGLLRKYNTYIYLNWEGRSQMLKIYFCPQHLASKNLP